MQRVRQDMEKGDSAWWTMQRGASPVVGTAIHDGHALPPGFAAGMAIARRGAACARRIPTRSSSSATCPTASSCISRASPSISTGIATAAIYLKPEQSWGVQVFSQPPSADLVRQAMRIHDRLLRDLRTFLRQLEEQFGRFVRPRRPQLQPPPRRTGRPAGQRRSDAAGQHRHLLDGPAALGACGRSVHRAAARVRVPRPSRWTCARTSPSRGAASRPASFTTSFPRTGCAIAVEFKKFFMDEWTGEADPEALDAIRAMIRSTLPLLEEILERSALTGTATARPKPRTPDGSGEILDCLEQGASVRRDLPGGGRVHIDRPLPFLCLHATGDGDQLAALDVATANASYLVAPDLAAAAPLLDALGRAMLRKFGAFMVIEVAELDEDRLLSPDSPFLPAFETIVTLQDRPAVRVRRRRLCRGDGEGAGEVPLSPGRAQGRRGGGAPGRPSSIPGSPGSRSPSPRSTGSRRPDGSIPTSGAGWWRRSSTPCSAPARRFSPGRGRGRRPRHRALGRRVFVEAVERVDRRIDQIARSFDFLLAITPINAEAARQEFRSSRFAAAPRLLYRPLTVEVDVEKRRLFSIPFDNLEDPLLYDLYRQKQQELDLMLTMIAARETVQFREASRVLYGSVEPALLDAAKRILAARPRAAAGRRPGRLPPRAPRGAPDDPGVPRRRDALSRAGLAAQRPAGGADGVRAAAADLAEHRHAARPGRGAAEPRGRRPPLHLLRRGRAGAAAVPLRPRRLRRPPGGAGGLRRVPRRRHDRGAAAPRRRARRRLRGDARRGGVSRDVPNPAARARALRGAGVRRHPARPSLRRAGEGRDLPARPAGRAGARPARRVARSLLDGQGVGGPPAGDRGSAGARPAQAAAGSPGLPVAAGSRGAPRGGPRAAFRRSIWSWHRSHHAHRLLRELDRGGASALHHDRARARRPHPRARHLLSDPRRLRAPPRRQPAGPRPDAAGNGLQEGRDPLPGAAGRRGRDRDHRRPRDRRADAAERSLARTPPSGPGRRAPARCSAGWRSPAASWC